MDDCSANISLLIHSLCFSALVLVFLLVRPSLSFRPLFGRLLRLHGPRYLVVLAPSWALRCLLGAFWTLLGASWSLLGASWVPFWVSRVPFDLSWAPLGRLLGSSWVLLGASWAVLAASWGRRAIQERPDVDF